MLKTFRKKPKKEKENDKKGNIATTTGNCSRNAQIGDIPSQSSITRLRKLERNILQHPIKFVASKDMQHPWFVTYIPELEKLPMKPQIYNPQTCFRTKNLSQVNQSHMPQFIIAQGFTMSSGVVGVKHSIHLF